MVIVKNAMIVLAGIIVICLVIVVRESHLMINVGQTVMKKAQVTIHRQMIIPILPIGTGLMTVEILNKMS
jgi:hypothetical protein